MRLGGAKASRRYRRRGRGLSAACLLASFEAPSDGTRNALVELGGSDRYRPVGGAADVGPQNIASTLDGWEMQDPPRSTYKEVEGEK